MKSDRLIIRIDSELKQKFKEQAERQDKDMTEVLIEYIEWYTKKP